MIEEKKGLIRKIIIDILFVLICLALVLGSAFILRHILKGNQESIDITVSNSFVNLLVFCIPGLSLVLALIFCGGYKLFLLDTDNIDKNVIKSLFTRLIPKLSLVSIIISLSLTIILPFLFEAIYYAMEHTAYEDSDYVYSMHNVLAYLGIVTIFVYLINIYRSQTVPYKKDKFKLIDDNLKIYDYIIFGSISLLSFFVFINADLSLTASYSFAILNGHFQDFYDYTTDLGMGRANYMVTTYLIFAIWNIPIRFMTGSKYYTPRGLTVSVILWNKVVLALFFFFTIILVYKICKRANMDARRARFCTYLYATSPIAIFAIFIFGQYDIFGLFFLLLAVYALQQKKNIWSALFIGIGITCKITVLVIYIPILLMLDKKIMRLIGTLILSVLPYLLLSLYYSSNETFGAAVGGFGALTYIIQSRITLLSEPPLEIYFFVFIFIILCGYCFFQKERVTEEERYHGLVTAGALASFCFYGLCFHHPQWFIIASPFIALLAAETKRYRESFLVLTLSYLAYFSWVLVTWVQNVDVHMMVYGVLGDWIGGVYLLSPFYFLKLNNFLFTFENIRSTYYTLFSGTLLIGVLIGVKYQRSTLDNDDTKNRYRGARILAIIPLIFYLSLCFVGLFLTKANI